MFQYLAKHPSSKYNKDNFTFSPRIIVGEFAVVRKGEKGGVVSLPTS